jgi:CheY-like chemotaxis protein
MIEFNVLVDYVQECLGRLHDPFFLELHPLACVVADAAETNAGADLARVLAEAIERLKPADVMLQSPSSAAWRRYRCLHLRYREGRTLQQVARELDVSTRQVSRDQESAIHSLATWMWAVYIQPRNQHAILTRSASRVADDPVSNQGEVAPLDAELAQLVRMSAGSSTGLEEIVQGVVATVTNLAQSRNVGVEVQLSDAIAPVAVSRTVLRQALFNLLSYAIELKEDSRIVLSAADTRRGVTLRLDIRGHHDHAIAKEVMPIPAANAQDLWTAGRRILELVGGSVELQRHGDSAVTIDVTLPPVQLHKVLVIDDNPDVVRLFRRYLSSGGYRLFHAGTAETALRYAIDLQPDVITLDLMMPSQDGWDILQRLKDDDATREIPIVVCSVLPEKALAYSLGIQFFLTKPVTRTSLQAVLQQCLKLPVPEAHRGLP